jgi:hypothetical protein
MTEQDGVEKEEPISTVLFGAACIGFLLCPGPPGAVKRP